MNKKYNLKKLKLLIKFLNNSNIYSKEYLINLLNRKKRLINILNEINNDIDRIILHIKIIYYQNRFNISYNLYKYLQLSITNKNKIIKKLEMINEKELFIMNKFNIKNSYIANYLIILKKNLKCI